MRHVVAVTCPASRVAAAAVQWPHSVVTNYSGGDAAVLRGPPHSSSNPSRGRERSALGIVMKNILMRHCSREDRLFNEQELSLQNDISLSPVHLSILADLRLKNDCRL